MVNVSVLLGCGAYQAGCLKLDCDDIQLVDGSVREADEGPGKLG